MSRRLLAAALLLLCGATGARAQSTRDRIEQAKALYQAFNVEQARPILLNIVSPGYLLQKSSDELVDAYKYLGASYALVDNPGDSATTFFVAALDIDPFTDLDPQVFSATEIGAFNLAKNRIFKVGIRPIGSKIVDPRVDSTAITFRIASTHRGNLRIEMLNRDSTIREMLYQGESSGERPIVWRGVFSSTGQVAPADVYQIRVLGTSTLLSRSQEVRDQQFFRVEQFYEALEDTLPAFGASDTLPTRIPARAPWYDLAKGLFAGAMAGAALPVLGTLDNNVKDWQTHAYAAGGLVIGSGVISFLYRRSNRSISANVRENDRRKALRESFNQRIRERNQARLDKRLLIITPATGFSR